MTALEPPFALVHFPSRPAVGGATSIADDTDPASGAGGPAFERPGGAVGEAGRLFREPARVLETPDPAGVAEVLREVDRAARRGLWAVGFVAYEAAPAFDPAMRVRGGGRLPAAWFGLFTGPDPTGLPPGAADGAGGDPLPSPWHATTSAERYRRDVRAAQRAIRRGDFYQVSHTHRLRAPAEGREAERDLALYCRLRASQGTGYHALLHLGRHRILSVSPELFFRRDPGGGSGRRTASAGGRAGPEPPDGTAGSDPDGWSLLCRPMKGTAPRGRWLEEDDARARRLAASDKERAENLMIVDLVRNDVSRVARPGSVRVPALFRVERYPTVLQMTSDVTGELDPAVDLADLFSSLFPAGSVTGAPKIEAMRHIAETETTPREIYCGTVGVVEPGGRATFNVAIRTLWIDAALGRAEYGTGGAVTHDSVPERERAEAGSKTSVLTEERPRFGLLETLRLENGELVRLDRHMARLASSARYFGFAPPEERAREALRKEADRRPHGIHRLRLTARPDGDVAVERRPFPGPPTDRPTVALSGEPVSRENRLLYHKTTHRAPYRRRRERRPGAFDVLLSNEEGELTEFTVGNLVVELEDGLWTPPRDCGLLAGTFRDELVEAGTAGERRLRPRHLEDAERIWLVNSLREWVEVELAEEPAPVGS